MSDDPAELPEDCVGPWLWDPAVDDPQQRSRPAAGDSAWPETRPDSLSAALLVVMETLPPLERAVFVLNEVFGYPHAEIADMLGRPPHAVRQLAHRAREHVQARRPHHARIRGSDDD
ncbi:sigma factor-like helix-turn-helix DNA-binding protein [Streptomyces sp. IBSBF 2435]|uniref:sigma factor-like helix-turn-helix DNA-binding protein n=1 Tax=Streptomyces sp. IBSBF 2435 TaxID=2903531 RepID=UPI002FDB9CB5